MEKKNLLRSLFRGVCLLALVCAVLPGMAEEADPAITFAGDQITTNAEGVAIEGGTVTITTAGTYVLTGSSSQGQVVVRCDGEAALVLAGLHLTSADGPVIDIQDAEQVTLTTAAGTENTLADGEAYASAADGQDAAVFSRADLILNGEGTLTVQGRYNDGIASRDTLRITGGSIAVEAQNHGVKGKDNLVMEGGTLTVAAGGDAVKATNADQPALGSVQIDGGTLDLTAQDDGISAISQILINGGDITIDTDNNGMKSEGGILINAGTIAITTGDDDFVCASKTISPEAVVTMRER